MFAHQIPSLSHFRMNASQFSILILPSSTSKIIFNCLFPTRYSSVFLFQNQGLFGICINRTVTSLDMPEFITMWSRFFFFFLFRFMFQFHFIVNWNVGEWINHFRRSQNQDSSFSCLCSRLPWSLVFSPGGCGC